MLDSAINGINELNSFDFILVILIIGAMYSGWRQGLVKTMGGMFLSIFALFFAAWNAKDLKAILEQTFGIQANISAWLIANFPVGALKLDLDFLGIRSAPALANPAWDIASWLMTVISFLIILFIICGLGELLLTFVRKNILRGYLHGLDGVLGLGFNSAKVLLIVVVLVGLLYQPFKAGQYLGMDIGIGMVTWVDESYFGASLLHGFTALKDAFLINV